MPSAMAPTPTQLELNEWFDATALATKRQSRGQNWEGVYKADPGKYQRLANRIIQHNPDMCFSLSPVFLAQFPTDVQSRLRAAGEKANAGPGAVLAPDGPPVQPRARPVRKGAVAAVEPDNAAGSIVTGRPSAANTVGTAAAAVLAKAPAESNTAGIVVQEAAQVATAGAAHNKKKAADKDKVGADGHPLAQAPVPNKAPAGKPAAQQEKAPVNEQGPGDGRPSLEVEGGPGGKKKNPPAADGHPSGRAPAPNKAPAGKPAAQKEKAPVNDEGTNDGRPSAEVEGGHGGQKKRAPAVETGEPAGRPLREVAGTKKTTAAKDKDASNERPSKPAAEALAGKKAKAAAKDKGGAGGRPSADPDPEPRGRPTRAAKRTRNEEAEDPSLALADIFGDLADQSYTDGEGEEEDSDEGPPPAKKARITGKKKQTWEEQRKALLHFLAEMIKDKTGKWDEVLLALGPEAMCERCFFHCDVDENGKIVTTCDGPKKEKARIKAGTSADSSKAEYACRHCRHSLKRPCTFKNFDKDMPIPDPTPLDTERLRAFKKWIAEEVEKKNQTKDGKKVVVVEDSDEEEAEDPYKLLADIKRLHVASQGLLAKAREYGGQGYKLIQRLEAVVKAKMPEVLVIDDSDEEM